MSLNFNQIRLLKAELAALECLEISIKFQWEKCCDHFIAFISERIFFMQVTRTTIIAWMSLNFCQTQQLNYRLSQKNQCLHFFLVAIDLILFKLAGKEEMHTILDVFQFWPNWDNRQHNYLSFGIQTSSPKGNDRSPDSKSSKYFEQCS